MAIFKALEFDGVNSLDYGIYITGEAVYNAPERAVEMINIPGKNGALALDQGRFENIEVTYHAGCFADSQTDFADKVMKFRNALASRYTYKRLTDEYHPDEYRLGLYKSGLEVDAVRYSTAGEFNITFDCKPQRFLVDGDRAISPTEWSDIQTESGELVTIDSDGSLAVKSLEVSLEPIQAGSGTPSPSNVRPISGRTEVVTQRTGKNLFNPNTLTAGYITTTGSIGVQDATRKEVCSDFIPVDADTEYFFSETIDNSEAKWIAVGLYDSNKTFMSRVGGNNSTTCALSSATLNGVAYVRITYRSYGIAENMQFERGTTATDYEPYQGNTYTTALGRTVYGGTLDVTSGVLTVDRAMVTIDGSESWSGSLANAYYFPLNSMAKLTDYRSAILCDKAPTYERNNTELVNAQIGITGYVDTQGRYPNQNWLYFQNRDCANVSALKTWLASNPLQVVYKLATPQTYQLTPQQIDLLLGTNHLWSDGEITVEYGVHPYYNPTPFASKPLIKVTGTGTLGIGEYILTITGTASQTLYIDCETMEIYTIEGTVPTGASSLVSINKNDFPVLEPGTNYISVGSGITAATITPRWWRI